MTRPAGLLIVCACLWTSGLSADAPKSAPPSEIEATTPQSTPLDKPVSSLRASLSRTAGETPKSRAASRLGQAGPVAAQYECRPWIYTSCEWDAPQTKHQPLLFEEPNLERMGYLDACTLSVFEDQECVWTEECLQPLVSGLHFVGNAAIIPYRCGVQPPCEPVYTLGHDRPGSPVCYRKHHLPLSLRGAAYQAGFVTGLVFFIP
jgi:hypothetical protein